MKNIHFACIVVAIGIGMGPARLLGQSDFPFQETRIRKNTVSMHGSASNYFDGGAFVTDLKVSVPAGRRAVPNGIDYSRQVKDRHGFLLTASFLAPAGFYAADSSFQERRGFTFAAMYGFAFLQKKIIRISAVAGPTFLHAIEELSVTDPVSPGELQPLYQYKVNDLGIRLGFGTQICLPLNFRVSFLTSYAEFFNLGRDDLKRSPDFPRFTRRRLSGQLGVGYSF